MDEVIIFMFGAIAGAIAYGLCIQYIGRKYTMKFINISTNIDEQNRKCIDELCEFISGVQKNNHENIIEEFFDVIQAMLGIIKILGLGPMLLHGVFKHNEKLRSRGWKLTEIDGKVNKR